MCKTDIIKSAQKCYVIFLVDFSTKSPNVLSTYSQITFAL